MDSVVEKTNDFVNAIMRMTSDFTPMTWSIIVVGAMIFGYAMLKGMNLHGR